MRKYVALVDGFWNALMPEGAPPFTALLGGDQPFRWWESKP